VSGALDARRVHPEEDANDVAVEQVRELLGRLPRRGVPPLFVFDAGYDPVRLQRGLAGHRAHNILLVGLHSNRTFYAAPEEGNPRPVGRPRRHGKKFALPDPETWTTPTAESRCEDDAYGSVRVRAWSGLHPKTRRIGERYGCERAPVVRGTVILVEVSQLPRETRKPKALWLWFSGDEEPDLDHLLWRAYVRRFDLEQTIRFLKQTLGWTAPRVRHPEQADRWAWLVLAAYYTQLRLARGPSSRTGGCPGSARSCTGAHAVADTWGFGDTLDGAGHPGEVSETVRKVAGEAQRTAVGSSAALPGAQESRLSPKRQPRAGSCCRVRPRRRILHG
jgi:Transposase DDE domain